MIPSSDLCLLAIEKEDFQEQSFIYIEVKLLSRVQLFVQLFSTPWTVAYQTSQSMGFSRQEYWSGLLFPSPGDLSDPGIEPGSPALQADSLQSGPPGKSAITIRLLK